MANFVLTEQVSALSYDLTPYAGKGTVPEPSALQIQSFRRVLAEMIGEMPQPQADTADQMELVRRVVEFLGKDTTEIDEKLTHAAADVCSGSPSYDELRDLPYRPMQAFLGWLVGMFLVPQLLTPATNT
jgi:hypothetical protein